MKTIEISDELYDRLIAADCCGFGLDMLLDEGLNCRQTRIEGRLRFVRTRKARKAAHAGAKPK